MILGLDLWPEKANPQYPLQSRLLSLLAHQNSKFGVFGQYLTMNETIIGWKINIFRYPHQDITLYIAVWKNVKTIITIVIWSFLTSGHFQSPKIVSCWRPVPIKGWIKSRSIIILFWAKNHIIVVLCHPNPIKLENKLIWLIPLKTSA